MVKNYLFKDRDGQTPLPEELQKDLIPDHVQTIGELDEYEEDNIARGLAWLDKFKGDHLSVSFWLSLHKNLFGKVWKWAGTVRKHELNNPYFHKPHKIWEGLRLLEQDLRYWLKEKYFPPRELSARFHERLQTIHPFANGNGRWGRIVTEYLCQRERFDTPTWGVQEKANPRIRRDAYIKAIELARRQNDHSALKDFMFS